MDETPHNYASYQLTLTSDLVEVADTLGSGWAFRGHTDATWDISSSLEREANRLGHDADRAGFEKAALKGIKQATPIEGWRMPNVMDDFSWLALLQHHGCKTRLVDFTQSFYVALYFAVRDLPGMDAAVWAIATSAMDARIHIVRERSNFELSEEETPLRLINNSIEWPERYQDDETLAIAYGKPQFLNQRLIAQQGLFLCPLNLNKSFKENLTMGLELTGTKEPVKRLSSLEELNTSSLSERVIKIRVPQSVQRNLLFHLKKMNITDATLFPGIDGFARSLNYYATGME